MPVIETFPLGDYQTNCYLLRQEASSRCVLIDPGYEPAFLLSRLEEDGLTLDAILLTHGHFDHVGGVRDLAAETDCRVYIHPDDLSMPPRLTAGPICYTDTYGEGDTVTEGGLSFRVLHTPGHTPGSVCLRLGNDLFCGDTLFAGSCGRTDLPGGNMAAMRSSLKRLAAIPDNLTLHPGHGPGSTLEEERMYNPYL